MDKLDNSSKIKDRIVEKLKERREKYKVSKNQVEREGLFMYIEELFQHELERIDVHYSKASDLLSLDANSLYSVININTSFSNPIILNLLEGQLFEKSLCYELVVEKEIKFKNIFPSLNFPRRKIENYSIKSMRIKSPELKELINEILSEDLGVVLKSGTICSPYRVDSNNNYLRYLEVLIGFKKGLKIVEEHSSGYDRLIAYSPDTKILKDYLDFR